MLDPAHRKGQPEGDVLRCLFPRLIEYRTGDAWGWRLGAASAIEQDGPTRVRFTLRPGILFTGGFGEMTADDVKFSYERIADPAQASEYRDDFAALDRVDVLDRYAGVIVLKEPFAPLWTSTLPSASGCILSRKAVEQAGGRFTTAPPATAGPYVIAEWRPKQRLTLVRNPDWNGPPGGFDEIRILPIEDEKAAEIAFEAGELDYTAISVSSIPGYRGGRGCRRPAGREALARLRLARHQHRGAAVRRPRGCGARCSGRSTSTRCSRRRISASPGARPGSSRPA